MQSVTQIKVGKHKTGIVGFDDALEEAARDSQLGSDQEIAAAMIKKLSQKNYIPSEAHDEYIKAFIREYKKFIGEPMAEEPLEHIEIKVLGAGCPNCDKLEMDLMELIEVLGITADLEHIRDIKEIARYGVMGSPALIINRKIKAVGSVPSKSKLKEFISQAGFELKKQQEQCYRLPHK